MSNQCYKLVHPVKTNDSRPDDMRFTAEWKGHGFDVRIRTVKDGPRSAAEMFADLPGQGPAEVLEHEGLRFHRRRAKTEHGYETYYVVPHAAKEVTIRLVTAEPYTSDAHRALEVSAISLRPWPGNTIAGTSLQSEFPWQIDPSAAESQGEPMTFGGYRLRTPRRLAAQKYSPWEWMWLPAGKTPSEAKTIFGVRVVKFNDQSRNFRYVINEMRRSGIQFDKIERLEIDGLEFFRYRDTGFGRDKDLSASIIALFDGTNEVQMQILTNQGFDSDEYRRLEAYALSCRPTDEAGVMPADLLAKLPPPPEKIMGNSLQKLELRTRKNLKATFYCLGNSKSEGFGGFGIYEFHWTLRFDLQIHERHRDFSATKKRIAADPKLYKVLKETGDLLLYQELGSGKPSCVFHTNIDVANKTYHATLRRPAGSTTPVTVQNAEFFLECLQTLRPNLD